MQTSLSNRMLQRRRKVFSLFWSTFLLSFVFPALGSAQQVFRYIDDELGDLVTGEKPVYSPGESWGQGANCTGCGFRPDATQAFNGTWHDTTHHKNDTTRSVQFSFTGTTLDVYCILPNPTDPVLTSEYSLTFTLDGSPIKTRFTHTTDKTDIFQFNASVLSLSNLPQTAHTFIIRAESTDVDSTVQFDYARYTVVQPETSSASQSPVPTQQSVAPSASPSSRTRSQSPAIIGGILGGIATILVTLLVFVYCRRRRHGAYRPLHRVDAPPYSENAGILESFVLPPILQPYDQQPPPYSLPPPRPVTEEALKRQQREYLRSAEAEPLPSKRSYTVQNDSSSSSSCE